MNEPYLEVQQAVHDWNQSNVTARESHLALVGNGPFKTHDPGCITRLDAALAKIEAEWLASRPEIKWHDRVEDLEAK